MISHTLQSTLRYTASLSLDEFYYHYRHNVVVGIARYTLETATSTAFYLTLGKYILEYEG